MTAPALNDDALTEKVKAALGIPTAPQQQRGWRLDPGTVARYNDNRIAPPPAADDGPDTSVDPSTLDDHAFAQLDAARKAGLSDDAAHWIKGNTPAELAADAHILAAERTGAH